MSWVSSVPSQIWPSHPSPLPDTVESNDLRTFQPTRWHFRPCFREYGKSMGASFVTTVEYFKFNSRSAYCFYLRLPDYSSAIASLLSLSWATSWCWLPWLGRRQALMVSFEGITSPPDQTFALGDSCRPEHQYILLGPIHPSEWSVQGCSPFATLWWWPWWCRSSEWSPAASAPQGSAFPSSGRVATSLASLVARRLLVYLSVILSFLFKNGIFMIWNSKKLR